MEKVAVPNNVLLPEVGRMIAQGVTVTLRTKGNSMLPFIVGERDSVVLQQPFALQVGDMVLAETTNHRYVLHRILCMDVDDITLMGDGNLQGVEHCRPADVMGKVVKIIRNGRCMDANSAGERRKAAVWRRLRPIRRWLLALYRRLPNKFK